MRLTVTPSEKELKDGLTLVVAVMICLVDRISPYGNHGKLCWSVVSSREVV